MSAVTPRPAAEPRAAEARRSERIAALLDGFSIEITARSRGGLDACRAHLAPGTQVYIASIPGDSYHSAVTAATKLAEAGFVPVPHIVARNIASLTQLNDFLARLAGEAGVGQALVVGGDADSPAGPFGSSLRLLQTGSLQKHGIRRVGIACYAEPNRRVETELLEAALVAKVELLRREGFDAWLLSQFCFDAALVVGLARRLAGQGIDLPLRVGLAGPVDARTLWKFALHCGIGNSMRALGARVDAISNLLVRHAPDDILAGIAGALDGPEPPAVTGMHFFAFGDVAGTAEWAGRLRAAGGRPG